MIKIIQFEKQPTKTNDLMVAIWKLLKYKTN